jgi:tetratricopeptide (TPR) repeat protein
VLLLAWPGALAWLAASVAAGVGLTLADGLRLLLGLHLLAATAFLTALGPPTGDVRGRPLWVAAGFGVGWLAPAWVSLPLALGAGLLSDQVHRTAPTRCAPAQVEPGTLACAAGATWAAATLWLHLRGGFDPTPSGGIAALSGGVSGFLAGRWLAARRPGGAWSAAAAAGLALLSVGLLLAVAVPWSQRYLPAGLTRFPPWMVLDAVMFGLPAMATFLFGVATPTARPRPGLSPLVLVVVGAALLVAIQVGKHGPLLLELGGVGAGIGLLLFGAARPARLAGLGLALVVTAGAWCLPPLEERWFVTAWATGLAQAPDLDAWIAERRDGRWAQTHIGPDGTWALRTVAGTPVADLDGVPLRARGRAAEATVAAAEPLALTAPRTERFLVLGDALGLGTATLAAHPTGAVLTAVPQPGLLQAWTAADPALRTRLLAPSVQLVDTSQGWALSSAGRIDGILALSLRPWADSAGTPLDGPFFALARRHLAGDGLYVGLLEVSDLAPSELRALLGAFAASFPRGVACLPPSGADHLILLGPNGDDLPSYPRLEARLSAAFGQATASSAGPLEVADRCVLPAARLAAWSREGVSRARWPALRLPSGRPAAAPTNLGVLSGAVGRPEECWELGPAPALGKVLAGRFEAAQHFLSLLAEAGRGDPAGLLAEAEALRAATDDTRGLQTLIEPHLVAATRSMEQARGEGPTSRTWQLAIDELVLARMIHPEAPAPLKLLGLVYEARGEVRKAEHQYQQALARDPADLDLLYGLARMASARGDDRAAEESLRRATEIAPQDWAAHQNLGVLLLGGGRTGEAEDTLRRAASLAPRDQAAPQAALAEVFLQEGRPRVALAQAELALRLEPSAYHWFLEGRCLLEAGDVRRAEAALQQAILLDPGFFLARGALGQIFAQRGDYQQAAEAFRAVLERDPGNEAAQVNLQQAEALLAAEAQVNPPGPSP